MGVGGTGVLEGVKVGVTDGVLLGLGEVSVSIGVGVSVKGSEVSVGKVGVSVGVWVEVGAGKTEKARVSLWFCPPGHTIPTSQNQGESASSGRYSPV